MHLRDDPLPTPSRPAADGGQDDAQLAELVHTLITSRYSVAPQHLLAPGPGAAQLQCWVDAAGAAPDHKELVPYRFIRIAPDQRDALAQLFADALLERDPAANEHELARARAKAQRAPELLLAVARMAPEHPDVPARDRYVTLGAALMNLLLAAHAEGFGGMLSGGRALRSARFAAAFALAVGEEPVCFVSLGTPGRAQHRVRPGARELLSDWSGPAGA